MSLSASSLTGQILIAMPDMEDPYFSKSVVLVCTHDTDGAMGVILNQPLQLNIGDLFEQLKMTPSIDAPQHTPVYFGGPVQVERGFVLHTPGAEYNTTLSLSEHLALTSSKDIIEAAAHDQGPSDMFIALGYAGWTAGQLEQELQQNAWLNLALPAPEHMHQLIFNVASDDKLHWVLQQSGIAIAHLSKVAGHA